MEQETLYNILSGAYGEVLETHAMWECIASLGIKPYKDGNQWCYLYGDNIQDGIVGFGETIFKAAWNFYSQIKTEEIAKCEHSGSSEIPKELEEAAKKFVGYDMDCDELRDYEIGIASFIAGYNLCKEQMLKEAVEGEISSVDVGDDSYVKTLKTSELQKAIRNYNLGDKVRIIVLPKED